MQRHTSRGIMTTGKKTIFYIFVLLIRGCDPVCLSPRYVKASLIWSISSAGMKLRMFLIYTEPSTMTIGEAGFEQLANMVRFRAWFRVPDTIFCRKNVFFCHKRYLGREIEVSMLYFSPNSLLTLHRIKVLKKVKHRFLTCRHPGTRRVSLHLISEVGNWVASRMQRVNTVFQFFMFFLN